MCKRISKRMDVCVPMALIAVGLLCRIVSSSTVPGTICVGRTGVNCTCPPDEDNNDCISTFGACAPNKAYASMSCNELNHPQCIPSETDCSQEDGEEGDEKHLTDCKILKWFSGVSCTLEIPECTLTVQVFSCY